MGIKRERNLYLEILRIFSMFLIILMHSYDHSGLNHSLVEGSSLWMIETVFFSLTQVCVNIFVMISGYFLVNSRFRLSKLGVLWIEVVFYSVLIKLVLMGIGEIPFSITSLVSCFLPFMTGRYWFVTIYFGLYLVSPFLKVLVNAINKKQHLTLVLVLTFIMSVMISIHPSMKGMNSGAGWGLAWFVTLYIIAAYIKLYYRAKGIKQGGVLLVIYLAVSVFVAVAMIISDKLGIGIIKSIVSTWFSYASFPVLIATVALFIAFVEFEAGRKKGGSSKVVAFFSRVSGATFGVYIIHAHANVCIEKYWQKLGILSLSEHIWYPLYQIGLVLAIFTVCALIDIVRQWLFKIVHIDSAVVGICEWVENKYRTLLKKI